MVHSPEQGFKLQLLAIALIAVLVFLHYLLWLDENGVRQTQTLRIGIQAQTEENAELAERNHALAAEIEDLKRGLMAIEERARADMGMIRPDETFYRLLEKNLSQPAAPHTSTLPPKSALPPKPPAPAAKPLTPAAKPSPPTNPSFQTAKPAPPAKLPAPVAKPAPKTSVPAPAPKSIPAAKLATPAAKPAPASGASQRHE